MSWGCIYMRRHMHRQAMRDDQSDLLRGGTPTEKSLQGKASRSTTGVVSYTLLYNSQPEWRLSWAVKISVQTKIKIKISFFI